MMNITSMNKILFLVGTGLIIGVIVGMSIIINGNEPELPDEHGYNLEDVDGGVVFTKDSMELLDESPDTKKWMFANNSKIDVKVDNYSIVFDGLKFSNESIDAVFSSYDITKHPNIPNPLEEGDSVDAGNYTISIEPGDTLRILEKIGGEIK